MPNIKFLELGDGTGLLVPLHAPDVGLTFWGEWTTNSVGGDGFTMTGPGTGVPAGSIGDIDNLGGSGADSEIWAGLKLGATYEVGDEFYTDFTWDATPGTFNLCTFSILMSHTPLNTDRIAEHGWFEIAIWAPVGSPGSAEVEISATSFTLGNFWDFYPSYWVPWEKGAGMRVVVKIMSMVLTGPTVANPNTFDGNDENWDMVLNLYVEPHGGGSRTFVGTWNANLPHNWLEHDHFLLYCLTDNPTPNFTIEEICILHPDEAPCVGGERPIVRETFVGAATADIDGRTPDGGGDTGFAAGIWDKHAAATGGTGALGITANEGVATGDYQTYTLQGIPLPPEQRVEVTAVWPRRDAATPGGPVYCAFQGSSTRPEDNPTDTLRSPSDTSAFSMFVRWDGGAGTAQIDATLSDGTHAIVTSVVDAAGNVDSTIQYTDVNGNPVTSTFNPGVPLVLDDPALCLDMFVTTGPGAFVTIGGIDRALSFSRPAAVTIASATHSATGGLSLSNVESTAAPGESEAFEEAYVDACIRHDPTAETCYRFRALFQHFADPASITYELQYVEAGDVRVMRGLSPIVFVDWEHDVEHTHSIEIDENNVIRCYRGTEEITGLHFELNADVDESDGDPIPILTTGAPATNVFDAAQFFNPIGASDFMRVLEFTVYGACETEGCTGGPDNPYPWEPPPIDPPVDVAREFPMQRGAWRAPVEPSAATAEGVQRMPQPLPGETRKWVMARGVWRPILIYDGDTIPEPDTPLPPHHDPCYQVPMLPPAGPVVPITGRFFGMSNTPLGALGDLFNGTQKALGPWYTSDLPFVASRGCVLVGAQGGKCNTRVNCTTWDKNYWIDATRAILAPRYALLLTHTASGAFFGYSCADDIESAALWNHPGGVPLDEFAEAVAVIKAEFPGIRIGARVRPGHLPFNPGLDFYTAQWSIQRGPAGSWAAHEYTIALSRNAYLIWSYNYLHGGSGGAYGGDFPQRYANGTIRGNGPNNWLAAPTEVATYVPAAMQAILAVDGSAAKLAGALGYQYLASYLAMADSNMTMMDAFGIAHNAVAVLPPPP